MTSGVGVAVTTRIADQISPFVWCGQKEEISLTSQKRTGWKSYFTGIPWIVTLRKRTSPNPSKGNSNTRWKCLKLQLKCTDILMFAPKPGNPEFRRDILFNHFVLASRAGWQWESACLFGYHSEKGGEPQLQLGLEERSEMGRTE